MTSAHLKEVGGTRWRARCSSLFLFIYLFPSRHSQRRAPQPRAYVTTARSLHAFFCIFAHISAGRVATHECDQRADVKWNVTGGGVRSLVLRIFEYTPNPQSCCAPGYVQVKQSDGDERVGWMTGALCSLGKPNLHIDETECCLQMPPPG